MDMICPKAKECERNCPYKKPHEHDNCSPESNGFGIFGGQFEACAACIPSPSPSEPQHFLNEDKLDEFRKKLREGYKWDCTVETFDQCTKTHCYICPHVKEIPPFYPEVAQQPEPQPLEPLIKQINDIIYKIAPELKIRQQVQMRIEIMQAITAHEQAETAAMREALLNEVADNDELLEVGRKAIEDELIEWRDNRLSMFNRGNGLVVREKDGKDSSVIRFGPETALKIGLKAIALKGGR